MKSALIRLNEIEKDIDLVLEEVEEDDSEFINQWRADMLQLKALADEVNKYGGNILNSNGSTKMNQMIPTLAMFHKFLKLK